MKLGFKRFVDLCSKFYTIVYAASRGIKIGKGCRIRYGAKISKFRGGSVTIGDKVVIHRGAMILTYGGDIRIGNRCRINPYVMLYGHGGLTIGNGTLIATHTVIVPANHQIDRSLPIHQQPDTREGIVIGDDVWIGAGARILDGVKINDGAVIGAGAVVRGELDPYGIYVGVPARKVGSR